jgi:hypothetical protein
MSLAIQNKANEPTQLNIPHPNRYLGRLEKLFEIHCRKTA